MERRKLVPIKNSVICKKVDENGKIGSVNGIYLTNKTVDLYEILDFSHDSDVDFGFKVGDVIMSCSTGDEIEVNKGEIVYLFKIEHVICKVDDEKSDRQELTSV